VRRASHRLFQTATSAGQKKQMFLRVICTTLVSSEFLTAETQGENPRSGRPEGAHSEPKNEKIRMTKQMPALMIFDSSFGHSNIRH
jgi:hypothetical protein